MAEYQTLIVAVAVAFSGRVGVGMTFKTDVTWLRCTMEKTKY